MIFIPFLYRLLASGYDASCRRIEEARRLAINLLNVRPGHVVYDVACGTGATLPLLAAAAGSTGLVFGVEQSPEMAALARQRAAGIRTPVRIVNCSVEDLRDAPLADRMLFSYTHDVLQSPRAIERLVENAAPGCRFAILGARFLPWARGFPVNLFVAIRARRYLSAFRGFRRPLAQLCEHTRELRSFARSILVQATWRSGRLQISAVSLTRLPMSHHAEVAARRRVYPAHMAAATLPSLVARPRMTPCRFVRYGCCGSAPMRSDSRYPACNGQTGVEQGDRRKRYAVQSSEEQ